MTEKRGSILIVEDDSELRKTIVDVLSMCGHDLCEADSGSNALKKIIERKPLVIISDLMMPNGSGLDLAKAITKHELKIPLVLVTGRRDLDTECYTEPSIKHILFKPFKPQEILSLVQELTKTKDASQ